MLHQGPSPQPTYGEVNNALLHHITIVQVLPSVFPPASHRISSSLERMQRVKREDEERLLGRVPQKLTRSVWHPNLTASLDFPDMVWKPPCRRPSSRSFKNRVKKDQSPPSTVVHRTICTIRAIPASIMAQASSLPLRTVPALASCPGPCRFQPRHQSILGLCSWNPHHDRPLCRVSPAKCFLWPNMVFCSTCPSTETSHHEA